MNPYISSTFVKDNTPFKDVLSLLNRHKIYSVEIGSNHLYEENYDYIKQYKEFDFLIHNYFPIPRENLVINIASQNKNLRDKSVDHIFKSIDFCHEIDSRLYTFHPGFLTDPGGSNLFRSNYDFQWDKQLLKSTNYKKSFDNMLFSLEKIIKYSKERKVVISIETEGSFTKKDHLLMQKPEEYIGLFHRFNPEDLGVNLNIGHLFLASKAFKFSIEDFIDLTANYIVAFELSHNDGLEDQHLPLQDNGWYWSYILDRRFENAYKILEFRNQSIETIENSITLFNKKSYEK